MDSDLLRLVMFDTRINSFVNIFRTPLMEQLSVP